MNTAQGLIVKLEYFSIATLLASILLVKCSTNNHPPNLGRPSTNFIEFGTIAHVSNVDKVAKREERRGGEKKRGRGLNSLSKQS